MLKQWIQYFSVKNLLATLKRFPLSVISSLAATILFWEIMTGNGIEDAVFQWLVLAFNGIILFTALALVEEGKKLRPLVLQVLALPVLYFFAFLNTEGQDVYGSSFLLKMPWFFWGV
jgi:hypothetical protein